MPALTRHPAARGPGAWIPVFASMTGGYTVSSCAPAAGIGRFRQRVPTLLEAAATPTLSAGVRRLGGREDERVRALDQDIKEVEQA